MELLIRFLVTGIVIQHGLKFVFVFFLPELGFIIRLSGSGCRVWGDAYFKGQGMCADSLEGYDVEETTDIVLANAIAGGDANVVVGIFAAASSIGLDFVPLTTEQYDLVIPDHIWPRPETQSLVEIVRSPRFKKAVSTLGGYDLSATGEHTGVE